MDNGPSTSTASQTSPPPQASSSCSEGTGKKTAFRKSKRKQAVPQKKEGGKQKRKTKKIGKRAIAKIKKEAYEVQAKGRRRHITGEIKRRARLRRILPFLQMFKDLRPVQRGILLGHLDDNSCEVLCETIANVLSNSGVSRARRTKLRKLLEPHKLCLRSLTRPNLSRKAKHKKLNEIGGLPISAILAAAIPLLISILRKD